VLTKLGAKIVIDSISYNFNKYLYKAIDATGATLAYDAFGGWLLMRFLGKLAPAEIGELKVYIEPE
jgi:NADPH:quinone reductase-like Zn-dependent oxidoreductase